MILGKTMGDGCVEGIVHALISQVFAASPELNRKVDNTGIAYTAGMRLDVCPHRHKFVRYNS